VTSLKPKYAITGFFLCLVLTASLFAPAAASDVRVVEGEPLNCHEMAEVWFGASGEVQLLGSCESPAEAAVRAWFSLREADFPGTASLLSADDVPVSAQLRQERQLRIEGIRRMQERANMTILDADVTARVLGEESCASGTAVYVYEWTFYDYDDLSDGVGGSDVAGYGVYHKLTLAAAAVGDTYCILADEYDETDVTGVCTLSDALREEFCAAESGEGVGSSDETASLMGYSYYSGYDPSAAVAYADKWVYHGATYGAVYEDYYNPAYYNFNPLGGDCANYASQCINAGGMPQVPCEKFGLNGWYYVNSNDRSSTWTSSSGLLNWMSDNRGKRVSVTAENCRSVLYMGSPVFYKSGHTGFCVGKNSAGTPIVNAHNNDKYHQPWDSSWVTTVQLTSYDPSAVSAPLSVGATFYVSETDMGMPVGTPTQGNYYHFCYQLFNSQTGLEISQNDAQNLSTTLEVLFPDGSSAKIRGITGASGSIRLLASHSGKYVVKLIVSGVGQSASEFSSTVDVQAGSPARINSVGVGESGGISASVFCTPDTRATAVCAVYDASGRLLDITSRALTAGLDNRVSFPVTPAAGGSARVFVLGADSAPLCESQTLRF